MTFGALCALLNRKHLMLSDLGGTLEEIEVAPRAVRSWHACYLGLLAFAADLSQPEVQSGQKQLGCKAIMPLSSLLDRTWAEDFCCPDRQWAWHLLSHPCILEWPETHWRPGTSFAFVFTETRSCCLVLSAFQHPTVVGPRILHHSGAVG